MRQLARVPLEEYYHPHSVGKSFLFFSKTSKIFKDKETYILDPNY